MGACGRRPMAAALLPLLVLASLVAVLAGAGPSDALAGPRGGALAAKGDAARVRAVTPHEAMLLEEAAGLDLDAERGRVGFIKSAWNKVKSVGKKVVHHVKKKVKKVWGHVKRHAKKAWGHVKRHTKKVWGHVKRHAKKAWGHVKRHAKKAWGHVKRHAKKAWGHVKRVVSAVVPSSWKSALTPAGIAAGTIPWSGKVLEQGVSKPKSGSDTGLSFPAEATYPKPPGPEESAEAPEPVPDYLQLLKRRIDGMTSTATRDAFRRQAAVIGLNQDPKDFEELAEGRTPPFTRQVLGPSDPEAMEEKRIREAVARGEMTLPVENVITTYVRGDPEQAEREPGTPEGPQEQARA